MQPTLKTYACTTIGAVAALAAGLAVPVAVASDAMPVTQQNALVQKYCAVCHNDAHVNGGLSLEHFDAAHPDPGVAAMLVSKLTAGLSPKQVEASHHDPSIAATIVEKMKTGAMGAAGLGVPDRATQDGLLSALSAEAAGASEWTVGWTQNPTTQARTLTASIVREVPSAANAGDTDMYRLTLTCQADTHEAEMVLAWAARVPPKGQVMSAVVDGKTPLTYQIEGSEKMFKGTFGTMGTGATILYSTQEHAGVAKLATPLPEQTLTVRNVWPDETVVFPFGGLTQASRQELSTCLTGSGTSR